MGMQINTNIAANNTYRNLTATQNDMSKSLEKLSSGLRINRASDDAAGLTVSEALKSQVGGLTVASRNAQDGISVVQTAEGSLSEVQSILQRVRDLAVQAGNDSNNKDSRTAITTEVTALTKELTRIGDSTNFNGTQLLDGSSKALSFQVGANSDASSQIKVDLTGANVNTIATAIGATNVGSSYTVGAAGTNDAVQSFVVTNPDKSVSTIATAALSTGGGTAQEVADALNKDTSFSGSLIATVDTAGKLNVKALNGGAVAVANPSAGLTAGAGGLAASGGLDFSTAAGAAAAIKVVDAQLTKVSTARADLGAVQNRFESVVKTLAVSTENLTAAGSRIRDTDMAAEMVKYTRSSILVQAGTAMLAQANQGNQGVLKLLQ
ncbi:MULTISPECIES: flagellin [unclassified Cryobacterium]|uniref:flagellin N-terminal helical domain-containing protein n=1 Tax=unclassified Cryobacterium TaxID=2649013 RepID=UPI00106D9CBD|nr:MULTISPECIES: flagellin [unclassified Cryobacterium]MEB0201434.1 flagellin [Cryobacterium sp. 5I3]MEB0286371.1 flagellin [Cryobacterium sp. 10S3]MEB0305768.1 flagellin [Cryobacterium sp. 10I1]TFB95277.1 flagellin [Cryobacterium sp. MDB2-A-1]TFC11312.1 flagellin [Cryobacterium sp. MDB2-A-2]